MKNERQKLGERSEKLVAEHYRKAGFKILEMNWRSRIGEIDIVCQKKDLLVFVEVKAGTPDEHGFPIERITVKKQEKLARLVELYLATSKISKKIKKLRVDGVEVLETGMGDPEIRIFENIIQR